MHIFGIWPKKVHFRREMYIIILHFLTQFLEFSRCYTISPLKLFTEICRHKAHLRGNCRDRHFWIVSKQAESFLQADIVDILRKGKSIGILGQQVVKCMAPYQQIKRHLSALPSWGELGGQAAATAH